MTIEQRFAALAITISDLQSRVTYTEAALAQAQAKLEESEKRLVAEAEKVSTNGSRTRKPRVKPG